MSLINSSIADWVIERSASKEDVQSYIDELIKVRDNWVDEVEEEPVEYHKYRVHCGYRYAIDLNIVASSIETAQEIGEEYASSIPITDERFYCADGDTDAWEENFDDEEADITEEDFYN